MIDQLHDRYLVQAAVRKLGFVHIVLYARLEFRQYIEIAVRTKTTAEC